jgi:branched-chain amino acid transport system permease protein
MTAVDFLNLCISALLLAGIYAAMSVGMTVIYGVMKIVNLAHAGFLMLGAYFVLELYERLDVAPLVGALLAFPVFFLAGLFVHWMLIRHIPPSDQPTLTSLLLMFGLWLVLQNLAYLVWGNSDRSILSPTTLSSVHIGPLNIATVRLVVFAAAACSLLVLELALHRTWFGRSVRALMQNRYAGLIAGIPVERCARLTFGLGIAFAGAAGGLLAMLYSFSPDFGSSFLIRSFVVVVLGGLESFSGLALGAIVLAFVETFSILVIPAGYQPAVAFALLVLALILLPEGLASFFGKRHRWT